MCKAQKIRINNERTESNEKKRNMGDKRALDGFSDVSNAGTESNISFPGWLLVLNAEITAIIFLNLRRKK